MGVLYVRCRETKANFFCQVPVTPEFAKPKMLPTPSRQLRRDANE